MLRRIGITIATAARFADGSHLRLFEMRGAQSRFTRRRLLRMGWIYILSRWLHSFEGGRIYAWGDMVECTFELRLPTVTTV